MHGVRVSGTNRLAASQVAFATHLDVRRRSRIARDHDGEGRGSEKMRPTRPSGPYPRAMGHTASGRGPDVRGIPGSPSSNLNEF